MTYYFLYGKYEEEYILVTIFTELEGFKNYLIEDVLFGAMIIVDINNNAIMPHCYKYESKEIKVDELTVFLDNDEIKFKKIAFESNLLIDLKNFISRCIRHRLKFIFQRKQLLDDLNDLHGMKELLDYAKKLKLISTRI
jgi:hypothetical protein